MKPQNLVQEGIDRCCGRKDFGGETYVGPARNEEVDGGGGGPQFEGELLCDGLDGGFAGIISRVTDRVRDTWEVIS
jgi:hypothetical protein